MSIEPTETSLIDALRSGVEFPEKTLVDLEFSRIIDELNSYAMTQEAKDLIGKRLFFVRQEGLELVEDLIAEILDVQNRKPGHPREGSPDIGSILERLSQPASILDLESLYALGLYLWNTYTIAEYYLDESLDNPLIKRLLSRLPDLRRLQQSIGAIVDPPGVIRESHPALRPLFAALDSVRRERSRFAESIARSATDALQNSQAVMRDGRIVLPVKMSHRSEFQGIVHDVSSTGSTMFVETSDLLQRNNAVTQAEQRIHHEIHRILSEISEEIRIARDEVHLLRTVIGTFDAYSARAAYIRRHGCRRSQAAASGFKILQARHPLLKDHAVPIDLEIGEAYRSVVMSGPNAGGKTVTIKTAGLMVLMRQFGLYVPGSEGSAIPIYRQVHTDIGDAQSIEFSLSTFSGHLNHISEIIRNATEDSLVILDELGSGTDPQEGAALARSILEFCTTHVGLTLITSHHTVLKQYAFSHPEVLNTSMEFDSTTHTPTFRVIPGYPGNSHAIETAARMGMPEEIIKRAYTYLSSESVEISTIIRSLRERETELQSKETEQEERGSILREERRRLDLDRLSLKQQRIHQKREEMSRLNRFLTEARSTLENLIREIKEQEQGVSREMIRKAKDFTDSVSQFTMDSEKRLEIETEEFERSIDPSTHPKVFRNGMTVYVGTSKKEGTILRKGKRPGQWIVEVNAMRMNLEEDDMIPADGTSKRSRDPVIRETMQGSKFTYSIQSSSAPPRFTLDVRGMTLQDAVKEIESQIDSALLHGLQEFSIIHGKGEGILQMGIRDLLQRTNVVRDYEYASPEDGGFGKTIVQLKF